MRTERPQGSLALLHFYGLLQLSLFFLLYRVSNWHDGVDRVLAVLFASSVLYGVSLILFRNLPKQALWYILFWAIAARLVLLAGPTDPNQQLSADIYRYLWEGRVVEQGMSPYRYPPNSAQLAGLRGTHLHVWEHVHHKEVSAIYPPAAQFLFALLPGEQRAFRAVVFGFELVLLLLLLKWVREDGLPVSRFLIYAWLPLPIIEIAGSGHFEGLFMPFVVGALYLLSRKTMVVLAAALLAVAACMKFVALIPLGFLIVEVYRNPRWGLSDRILSLVVPLLIVGLLYAPFVMQGLPFGSIGIFARDWRFNGGIFYSMEWFAHLIHEGHAHWIVKGLVVWCIVFCGLFLLAKRVEALTASVFLLALLTILSPVIYPWYLLWFAPLLPLLHIALLRYCLAAFCCTALFSYEVLMHPLFWEVSPPIMLLEYAPLMIGFIWLLSGGITKKKSA